MLLVLTCGFPILLAAFIFSSEVDICIADVHELDIRKPIFLSSLELGVGTMGHSSFSLKR
jgi:hypothetical protein